MSADVEMNEAPPGPAGEAPAPSGGAPDAETQQQAAGTPDAARDAGADAPPEPAPAVAPATQQKMPKTQSERQQQINKLLGNYRCACARGRRRRCV